MSMLAALGISALMLFTGLFSSLGSDDCRVGYGRQQTGPAVEVPRTIHSAPGMDLIQTNGSQFVNASGDPVTLRGFVTVTHSTNGQRVDYTLDDYKRMRDMGANYQSIRIGGGMLGVCDGQTYHPAYLEHLDQMVALASEVGIYTTFKFTFYDINGVPGLGSNQLWSSLWNNDHGEQDQVIEAWRVLWERYKGDPAVIGYDLLNEPEHAGFGSDMNDFQRRYLTPFYRNMIDEMQATDSQKLAFIQPALGALVYDDPVQRSGVVYAPHYYPNFYPYMLNSDYSTRGYQFHLYLYARDAQTHNAPLFIGEFGMPWDPANDGNAELEQAFQNLEDAAVNLFDQYNAGFSRPWFTDDNEGLTFLGFHLNWSLIRGTNGLSGEDRSFITDVLARPYPRKLAGTLSSFSFNQQGRTFQMDYTPSAARGATEIYVPRARHYENGFEVVINRRIAFWYDPNSGGTLQPMSLSARNLQANLEWDEVRQVLTVHEWTNGQSARLEIRPRP